MKLEDGQQDSHFPECEMVRAHAANALFYHLLIGDLALFGAFAHASNFYPFHVRTNMFYFFPQAHQSTRENSPFSRFLHASNFELVNLAGH